MSKYSLFADPSELEFGDVEWIRNPYGTSVYDAGKVEAIAVTLGTKDPEILANVEIGRVVNGPQKDKIIGFKNLPEGFVPANIDLYTLLFCELCRALDSRQNYQCNNCNTRMCEVCRNDDSCCDKYSRI